MTRRPSLAPRRKKIKRLSPGEETFALHLVAHGVAGDWDREVRFHPVRKWRFDFANQSAKIAVEIEGGIWSGGRHGRGAGYESDLEKYNAAAMLGWRVLRFSTEMVKRGEAIDTVANMQLSPTLAHAEAGRIAGGEVSS